MIQNQWRRLSGFGRLFENFSVGISLELGSWILELPRKALVPQARMNVAPLALNTCQREAPES
jgi:hypothetical protein